MKRLLAGAVLAIGLSCAVVGPASDAAPARAVVTATVEAPGHNQTNYSLWYCSWARQYANDEVVHSVADYLTADAVRFYCEARHNATSYQYWVWTGIPIGQYGYIMGSGYQWCYQVQCQEPNV